MPRTNGELKGQQGQVLQVNDRVLAVNGVSWGLAMAKELHHAVRLEMSVLRVEECAIHDAWEPAQAGVAAAARVGVPDVAKQVSPPSRVSACHLLESDRDDKSRGEAKADGTVRACDSDDNSRRADAPPVDLPAARPAPDEKPPWLGGRSGALAWLGGVDGYDRVDRVEEV